MNDEPTAPTEYLDATGLLCPLPVLKIRKRLLSMAPGSELAVVASDPAAQIDVPHYCAESGHTLIKQSIAGDQFHFTIRRK